MSSTPTTRGSQIFEEGAGGLASLWDDDVAMVREAQAPDFHTPRGTLAYAHVLLRDGDAVRAERAIRAVLALQETRPLDAHRGNFRWLLEDATVGDLNGVEFMLDDLIELAGAHASSLGAAVIADMRRAIALGLAEIDRLDVHPSYTNIALSDIANSVLGGELLGESRYVERGARRLNEWLAFTAASGAPHEFNSATYGGVDILRLAALAERTTDPRIARAARLAEERIWLHVAAYYHPGVAQLGGPHSRAYFDGWSGAGGLLKLVLWRLLGDDALRRDTPYAQRTREEGHIPVALATLHCPDYVERWLRDKRYPFESTETASRALGLDITSYMTENYALGTASCSYQVGDPPEPWPAFNSLHLYTRSTADPGYAALYVRYVVNDKAPGVGREREDHWDEGQHVGVQHRNRAIVAYAPQPRVAPARSYKLSLRMLGVARDDVWIGEQKVEAWPVRIEPGQRIVVALGAVYVAIVPLKPTDMGSDATIEMSADAIGVTLDLFNYRGPAKNFWEYRSGGAGPFFKSHVRNAFVLEVGDPTNFAGLDAFRAHVAGARIKDITDAHRRRDIEYQCGCGDVALAYNLRDMTLVERRHDGVRYAPVPARVGATDGGGIQFAQVTGATIQLGRATLSSSVAPQWLMSDDDACRYVLLNPHDERCRISLNTPHTAVTCHAFPLGRIEVDEAEGVVRVDADVRPDQIHIGPATVRLSVNGVELPRQS